MPAPSIAAANRLADLLDQENTALKAMDLPLVAALLPDKTAAIADLAASGNAVQGLGETDLKVVARRLERLASENQRLLERAIAAQQRVIGIVVRAAASAAAEPGYDQRGRRARPGAMALSTRA